MKASPAAGPSRPLQIENIAHESFSNGLDSMTPACAERCARSTSPLPGSVARSWSSSDAGESGGTCAETQKHKHKLVEQSRRAKTRTLTAELQALVPSMTDFDKGTGINTVLEEVLEFLRDNREGPRRVSKRKVHSSSDDTGDVGRRFASVPRGILARSFDTAPMAVALCSMTGQLMWYNRTFSRMFVVSKADKQALPTMFNLTHPESLPATMMAATAIITGQTSKIRTSKFCWSNGNKTEMQVEMTGLSQSGKIKYICCFARTVDKSRKMPAITLCEEAQCPPPPAPERIDDLLQGCNTADISFGNCLQLQADNFDFSNSLMHDLGFA